MSDYEEFDSDEPVDPLSLNRHNCDSDRRRWKLLKIAKQFHAVNIKLMKTGSLIVARDFLREAKKHNLEAMMGCMIETTIGISYGMLFTGMVEYVDLDGFLLVKDEPFHLVSEKEGLLSLN